jgi:lipid-A-disaccharide synthase-like uncharacterized protein
VCAFFPKSKNIHVTAQMRILHVEIRWLDDAWLLLQLTMIYLLKNGYPISVIDIDDKQGDVISLPIWKGSGVESLQNISKEINQSIAGKSNT